jgi:hypothetical protein
MKSLIVTVAIAALAIGVTGCHRLGLVHGSGHSSIRTACAADIQQFCADVDRTQMRSCFKSHADQLSAGCKAALAARKARSGAPPASAAASASAPANK